MVFPSELAAFIDLLRQPYPLDPGSLEVLVEEAQKLPRGTVHAICSLLEGRELTSVERENVENFIRRATNNVGIMRDFVRSVRPVGRCPKSERAWLRRLLVPAADSAKSDLPPATQQAPVRHSLWPGPLATERLDLRDLSGSISEFPELLDRLGELSEGPGRLDVALAEFTYSSALAVIAQWIFAKDLRDTFSFVDTAPQMRRYLDDI